jgi:formate hydrogenlyase transcriptional activator
MNSSTMSVPLTTPVERSMADRYQALFRVSQAISAHRDPKKLFSVLAGELRNVIDFKFLSILLYNEQRHSMSPYVLHNEGGELEEFELEDFKPEETLSWWVCQHQEPLTIPYVRQESRFPALMEYLAAKDIQSTCSLPLTASSRRLGGLCFGSQHPNAYSESETAFLSLVANQVAVAIDDALNYEATRAAQAELQLKQDELQLERDRLTLLLDVNNSVSSNLELRDLLRAVSASVRRLMQCDAAGVHLPEGDGKSLRIYALDFPDGKGLLQEEELAPIDKTPPGRAFTTGQPFVGHIRPTDPEECREEKLYRQVSAEGIRTGCFLPLIGRKGVLGVLSLGRRQENAFSQSEVDFLTQVAGQVAIALENSLAYGRIAKLKDERQREKDRLQLLLDVNNSVVSNLELRELLRAVSASVRRVMQCDVVSVDLPDADRKQLRIYALDFPESKGLLKEESLVPTECSPAGEVFRSGKPLVLEVDNPDAVESCQAHRIIAEEGIRSGCMIPLIGRNGVLGVLALGSRRENAFREDDVDFLMQLAGQVGIAMDNAFAYGQIAELKDQLAQEKLYLEDEIRSEMNFDEIIGGSAALRRVLQQVETVAPTDSAVLILGETGTGKELVARAIHNLSRRKDRTFVKLNCAAIPTGLLESELFGHEKGAFTGAISQRIGRFELANNGTAFLDEIGEIPLELQPKLLRVLQEREFERLGSSRTLRSDARLVAATNRDLGAMVEEQKFRADLFYRLNVFPVRIPALRERREDIPLLVRHFAQQFARRSNKSVETIPSEVMNALVQYHWPGNVRELQNVIERAVILSSGPVLRVPLADLKPRKGADGAATNDTLEEAERRHIMAVLGETNWVVGGPSGAAQRLGMNRSTLQFRMRKLGIARPTN